MAHLEFKTLHAHLCGAPEMAAISTRALTILYPLTIGSYAPFLREFYVAKAAAGLTKWDVVAATPSAAWITVANATLPGYFEDRKSNHPTFNNGSEIRLIEPVALELCQLTGLNFKYTLMKQLSGVQRLLYVMAHWNEQAVRKLKPHTVEAFESAVAKVSDFYGVRNLDAAEIHR